MAAATNDDDTLFFTEDANPDPNNFFDAVFDGLAGNDTVDFSTNLTFGQNSGDLRVNLLRESGARAQFAGVLIGFVSIENITGSDNADLGDTIGGNNTANILRGVAGDDRLFGRGGDDRLEGGVGNDVLAGSFGIDTLLGGAGDDRLNGGPGADSMAGGDGNDVYTIENIGDTVTENVGEGAKDRINTLIDATNADNVEFFVGKFAAASLTMTGNSGAEKITGSNITGAGDTINGLGGNDRIAGLAGDDILQGGAGNDRIFGGDGDDVISGGAGVDRVTGQAGQDRFIHAPGDSLIRITDFDVTEDLLDLTAHGLTDFAAFQAATVDIAEGARITLGSGNFVILQGITEATIGAEDVLI